MDQNALVNDQILSGEQLFESLLSDGFDIRVAFWARSAEDGEWSLYLASPIVDEKGATAAYRVVNRSLRKIPSWIDPFEIKVVGLKDSLTDAAFEVWKPNIPKSQLAATTPIFSGSICQINGSSAFSRLGIDRVLIYSPPRLPVNTN